MSKLLHFDWLFKSRDSYEPIKIWRGIILILNFL